MTLSPEDSRLLAELCDQHGVSQEKVLKLLAARGQRPHADASTGNSSRWRYGVNMAS